MHVPVACILVEYNIIVRCMYVVCILYNGQMHVPVACILVEYNIMVRCMYTYVVCILYNGQMHVPVACILVEYNIMVRCMYVVCITIRTCTHHISIADLDNGKFLYCNLESSRLYNYNIVYQ